VRSKALEVNEEARRFDIKHTEDAMKKHLLWLVTAAIFAAMLSAAVAAQQQQVALTVTINSNGQPASDVQVVLELANKNKVSSATTASDGTASLNVLDIANMGKVQVDVVIEQDCPDGQTHVIVTVEGQQPDDNGCKKHKKALAFLLIPGGGQHLIVDIGLGTAAVTPSGEPIATPAATSSPATHLVWVQFGGNVGFKQFNNLDSCNSILIVFPGADCKAGDKSVAAGVEGTFGITPYFGLGVVYTRTGQIQRTSETSSSNDSDKIGTQFTAVTGQGFLPLKHVIFSAEAGAAFSQFREMESQALASGSPPSTVVTHLHDNVVGPMVGGRIQIPINHLIAVQARYDWVRAKDQPGLDEHNNVALFGIVITLQ